MKNEYKTPRCKMYVISIPHFMASSGIGTHQEEGNGEQAARGTNGLVEFEEERTPTYSLWDDKIEP